MLTDHGYNVAAAQMAEETTGPEIMDEEMGSVLTNIHQCQAQTARNRRGTAKKIEIKV